MIINGLTKFRRSSGLIISLSLSALLGACNTLQPEASLQTEEIPGHMFFAGNVIPPPIESQPEVNFSTSTPYVELSIDKPDQIAVETGVSGVAEQSNNRLLADVEVDNALPSLALKMAQSSEAFAALQQQAIEALEIEANAWYRLQRSMSWPAVDNKRVAAQLKWYLNHRGYLERVMQRAGPILYPW
jgi:hypothetical protein